MLFYGTSAAALVATVLTISAIQAEDDGGSPTDDGMLQAILIFWILTGLGYLLLPVLQRFTAIRRSVHRKAEFSASSTASKCSPRAAASTASWLSRRGPANGSSSGAAPRS